MSGFWERLDPRTRVLLISGAIVMVGSTPHGRLGPFLLYAPLCLLAPLFSRASALYILWRCLAASPFLLLAGGFLLLKGEWTPAGIAAQGPAALSVLGKGYLSAWLLSFLTASTPLPDLLLALRRLGAPESLNLILAMMHRYAGLLSEEYARMERARACRTVRDLGPQRYRVAARQMGELVLRSWDRAERIHAAMLSRGFHGAWPAHGPRPRMRWVDAAALSSAVALFAAARFWG